ncbi:acyl-CoA dehydrogenase family protein [Bradyrhizobium tropiciagri]|uniref:acyl-CoA dehydrogenase family protein n=1 Tax=Bradyrhizobium tropiciagri TaxID=312253 RepID=UPI0024BF452A|nr:acyl-CoA dehydrogenase family protein [Bradyrhizobium tropiciagri]
MDANWSGQDLAFRDEVRRFFADTLTPEIRRAGSLMTSVYADHDLGMEWQRILHEKGWAAPAWPVEHGGCSWTTTQRYSLHTRHLPLGHRLFRPWAYAWSAR